MSNFYIYGRRPIIAALKADANISKVFIQYGASGDELNQINFLAKKNNIPVTTYDKGKFQNLLKNADLSSENHQGVIALKEIGQALPLFQLVEEALEVNDKPVLLFLDEIQDPHNLGSIARSAESSGVAGLIIPDMKSSLVTPVAFKTSAGALEYLPYSIIKNSLNTLKYLKEKGFWIIGTDMQSDKNYTQLSYDFPLVLIIGNEGKGVRKILQKECDYIINIPSVGKTESLNASVSAAIIMFEILRQRTLI